MPCTPTAGSSPHWNRPPAPSLQKKCQKQQALQNKREFDKRAKGNDYDHQYKNECQGWRNVFNKAKKTPGFPPERLAAMQAAFEAFKKEALRRKTLVKNKQSSPEEFRNWLVRQKSIIFDLMEEM